MKRILTAVCFSAMLGSAQTGIQAPRLGFVADGNGSLRPLLGFPGNLLLGDPIAGDVVMDGRPARVYLTQQESAPLPDGMASLNDRAFLVQRGDAIWRIETSAPIGEFRVMPGREHSARLPEGR